MECTVSSTVNMHEAKTTLSRLVERALAGEEVVIAKDGKPLVKLVPIRVPEAPRQPGRLRGRLRMAPDFDRTPEDVIDAFEGKAG
jgi:prevent-host-death family protein